MDASMIPPIDMKEYCLMPQQFGYEFNRYESIHSLGYSMIRTFVRGQNGIRRPKNMGEGLNNAKPLNLDTLPT